MVDRLHGRPQIWRRDRLRPEDVEAGLRGAGDFFGKDRCAQRDDWNANSGGAEISADLDPAALGQLNIEQHEVEFLRQRPGLSAHAVPFDHDLVFGLERGLEQLDVEWVVFNDENSHAASFAVPRPYSGRAV